MNAKVSVIIPLFNKARFIARAIESVLSQTFNQFELIIVNDGSTDSSAEVVNRYKDSRIKLFHRSNSGPGGARNFGIERASAELLAFLDGDDEWWPNFLAESIKLLKHSHPETVSVSSGYVEVPQIKMTKEHWYSRGIRDQEIKLSPLFSPLYVVHLLAYMSSWSTLVKSETVRRWGGFYSADHCNYGEDAFLWLQVLFNERIRTNLEPLVNYHRQASELSKLPRPVEPFLSHPDPIRHNCPTELQPLLEQVLTIRAFKTACVLALSGQLQTALALMRKFECQRACNLPYFLKTVVGATRLEAVFDRIINNSPKSVMETLGGSR